MKPEKQARPDLGGIREKAKSLQMPVVDFGYFRRIADYRKRAKAANVGLY